MNSQQFRVRVLSIRHLTRKIREITLEVVEPETFHFLPGQAVAVTIPERGSELPLLRYYSLASPPRSSKRLSLLLNSADQGKGSSFLLEHEVGHEFQIMGPYGSFVLQEDPNRKLIFVGTGTGIAPLWSMIATLLETHSSRSMMLLWGLRSEPDIYYLDELQAWTNQHKNFSFLVTLSQPSRQWDGKIGRVTDLLRELPAGDSLAVYVCGNRPMVKEVADLLKSNGDCRLYRERHHEGT